MIASAIPIAIVGNVVRITTVIIVGDAISYEAGVMIEQKFGFVTFAVALGCIFGLGHLLQEKSSRSEQRTTISQQPEVLNA